MKFIDWFLKTKLPLSWPHIFTFRILRTFL